MPLNPQALSAEWGKAKFRPVYYLFGEDSAAKRQALQELKKHLQASPLDLNEFCGDLEGQIAEILSCCQTPPMLSKHRIVILRVTRLGQEARKALAAYLKNPLSSTLLVVLCEESKPDPKDALADAAEKLQGLVVFRALKEAEAVAKLRQEAFQAGLELGPGAAELVVEEVGQEWGALKAELDKLKLLAQGRRRISNEDAEICLGYRQETNPFELANRLEKGDFTRAIQSLRHMLEEGAEPLRILYQITRTLNRQLKAKRLARSGAPRERVLRELRLSDYYGRDFLLHVEKIQEKTLIDGLRNCLNTEVALKSVSSLDPGLELEQLLLKLSQS